MGRWHGTLKAAVICNSHIIDALPVVLLGLRATYKRDVKASPAEMVPETTGDFFYALHSPADPEIFLENYWEIIRAIKPTQLSHRSLKLHV